MRRARRDIARPALWSPAGVEPLGGTPYLTHLERLLPPDGRGPIADGGHPLPDEPPVGRPDGDDDSGWQRASLDGVLDAGREPDHDDACGQRAPRGGVPSVEGGRSSGDAPLLAAAAVLEACRNPLGTIAVHTVAERLTVLDGPHDVDRMLAAIRLDLTVSRLRLAELARWLCRFGVRARQVAGGLALLGISGTTGDIALVSRLGLLDAVTLYAAVALRNLLPAASAEAALFDLAKQVEGWGRVHCVLRLRHSQRPDVATWLLRGGYDSGVAVEELAYVAVTTGGLVAALQGDDGENEDLLDHAGTLLGTLTTGLPGGGMSDWPAGELALELYLERMTTARPDPRRLHSLRMLDDYLRHRAGRNPHFSAEGRARSRLVFDRVLGRPEWNPTLIDC